MVVIFLYGNMPLVRYVEGCFLAASHVDAQCFVHLPWPAKKVKPWYGNNCKVALKLTRIYVDANAQRWQAWFGRSTQVRFK